MADLGPRARELGARIIFVDDGSTDGTAEIIEAHREGLHLAVVRHEVNRGLGTAINSGLRAALGESSRRRRDRHHRGRQHLRPRRPAADARAVRAGLRTSCSPRCTRRAGGSSASRPGGWPPPRRSRTASATSAASRRSTRCPPCTASIAPARCGARPRPTATCSCASPGFAANVELLLKLYNAGANVAEVPDGQRLEPPPGRLQDEPQADGGRLRPAHGRAHRRAHPAAAALAARPGHDAVTAQRHLQEVA